MKYFLLIADGMADAPLPSLGGKTPLAAAKKPNMDHLSSRGTLGMVRTIPPECAPGSDSGILTLLGYDPRRYLTGRSALEAVGRNIPIDPGQAACRWNFVTIQDGMLLSPNGGCLDQAATCRLFTALRSDPGFSALCEGLGVRFCFHSPYRLLCIGPAALLEALDSPPPNDLLHRPVDPLPFQASPGVSQLMERAAQILADCPENRRRKAAGLLPATDIWPWAPGKSMALPSFSQKYGKQGVVITATALVQGIAKLAGLSVLCPAGATGGPDTDYSAKAQAAVNCFEAGTQLVCLHVEAPDECAHNGNPGEKKKAIEAIDRQILGPVFTYLAGQNQPFRILVVPDHETLTATGCHGSAPVPWLLYDSRTTRGETSLPYSEGSAAQTGNEISDGTQLMSLFFRYFEKQIATAGCWG